MVDAFRGEGRVWSFFLLRIGGERGNMGRFFYNRGAWSRHSISNIGYGMMVSDIYHRSIIIDVAIPQQFLNNSDCLTWDILTDIEGQTLMSGPVRFLCLLYSEALMVVMLKRSEDNPVTKPYRNKMGAKALTQEKDKGPFVSKVGWLPWVKCSRYRRFKNGVCSCRSCWLRKWRTKASPWPGKILDFPRQRLHKLYLIYTGLSDRLEIFAVN